MICLQHSVSLLNYLYLLMVKNQTNIKYILTIGIQIAGLFTILLPTYLFTCLQ